MLEIDRGLDLQARAVGRAAAVALLERAPHVLDVVAARPRYWGPRSLATADRLRDRRPRTLAFVDEAVLVHAVEHVALARARAFGVAPGRIAARRLRQAGEQRRLGERQLRDLLAEVLVRGRGDAVGAGAEIDLVQVEVEDLVLRELPLEAKREDDLLHLALVAPLRGQQQRLHDLLRDRAAALHDLPGEHVVEERAHDALEVDAAVPVERRRPRRR